MTSGLRSFDRVAGVYDETRAAPPAVAAAVTDALLRSLRELAAEPRVLEVGIGTGRIAVPLAGARVRITGFDISPKMLGVLRGKGAAIDVLLAEAAHQPFRPASFDAALFVHILHLVPDVEATVRESMRAVRPGGALIRVSDDHDEAGHHLEAGRIMWDVVEELTGVRRPADRHVEAAAVFERVIRSYGGSAEERTVMAYDAPFSAARALEHMRRRDFSSHWMIPDAVFDDAVVAVERRYRQLWGNLEMERPARKTVRLTVARLA
jgi:ubiquinone/menaquinone biosynthesis C-methylase UbiE